MAIGKKTGGRLKGTPNKTTLQIRESFHNLIENNLDNMTFWLEQVAKDSPEKALMFLSQLSEFIVPKLQRSEVHQQNTGETVIRILRNGTNGQPEGVAPESAEGFN